jgi:DNA-binding CsgD family transcriptional regulator
MDEVDEVVKKEVKELDETEASETQSESKEPTDVERPKGWDPTKDELDDYEKDIAKGYEKTDATEEEMKERWRERYVEEVQNIIDREPKPEKSSSDLLEGTRSSEGRESKDSEVQSEEYIESGDSTTATMILEQPSKEILEKDESKTENSSEKETGDTPKDTTESSRSDSAESVEEKRKETSQESAPEKDYDTYAERPIQHRRETDSYSEEENSEPSEKFREEYESKSKPTQIRENDRVSESLSKVVDQVESYTEYRKTPSTIDGQVESFPEPSIGKIEHSEEQKQRTSKQEVYEDSIEDIPSKESEYEYKSEQSIDREEKSTQQDEGNDESEAVDEIGQPLEERMEVEDDEKEEIMRSTYERELHRDESKDDNSEVYEDESEGRTESAHESPMNPARNESSSESVGYKTTSSKRDMGESTEEVSRATTHSAEIKDEIAQCEEQLVESQVESKSTIISTEKIHGYTERSIDDFQRWLRETFENAPEYDQEMMVQFLRELIKDEDDFRENIHRHNLNHILEDKEIIGKVQDFLRFKAHLVERENAEIEDVAKEVGIKPEKVEAWARIESITTSLKEIPSLEGDYQSRTRLHEVHHLHVNEGKSQGEIARALGISRSSVRTYLRNWAIHRQYYSEGHSFQQIAKEMNLSIKILRNIFRKYGWKKEIDTIENLPWEIKTANQFYSALNHHSELRFWEIFDNQYKMVQQYFDGKIKRKPKLLKKLESLELRRYYEITFSFPPDVQIESMQDVESLQDRHKKLSVKEWEICRKYFEVRDNKSLTEKQLATLYGISKAMVFRWRNRKEPPPIAKLRQKEEMRILREWAKLRRFNSEPVFYNSSPVLKHKQDIRPTSGSDKTKGLNLIDLYKEVFFHFASRNKLAQFILNIKKTQNLWNDLGLHSTLQYLNHLLKRTFPHNRSKTYISVRYNQIKGEYLRFLLNLSSWSTAELEESISEISGISGPGGIPNPRFPKMTELEIVLSRIISIVITDSHLRSNGVIIYHEPDIRRIRIVEKYLQIIGDIKLNPIWDERTNHYITTLPAVIGKALLHLGLTPGNKTINNPGLFPSIFNFSWAALCAFLEELIPQDGTVKTNRIDWSHSHTLHSGTEKSFKSLISQEEVDFVIKNGTPYNKYRRLSMGRLKKLTKSNNQRTSIIASKLLNHLYQNPNNLIEYEVEIARILGIDLIKEPQSIFYHKRTNSITVSWSARTANINEAIKIAMIAPPNDVKKRKVVRKAILNNPDIVDGILSYYANRGIDVKKWWDSE